MNQVSPTFLPHIQIEQVEDLDNEDDLHEICETLEAAILDGYHCYWVETPPRDSIENHFKGALLVPEKLLFIGRMDGHIVAVCEVTTTPKKQGSQHISATINIFTVAPYALRIGIGRKLLTKVEQTITQLGFPIINILIDETQDPLFQFYCKNGYHHWATHPYHQKVKGQIVKGLFLYKSFLNT